MQLTATQRNAKNCWAYYDRHANRVKAQQKVYREANRARIKAYQKEWEKLNPDKVQAQRKRVDWTFRNYGITRAERDAMEVKQGGRCLICGEAKKLHVDHDHETKVVRGLLCLECNTGLGKFKEDPQLFLRAIEYLKAMETVPCPLCSA